jgi:mRNA interferase HigB
VRIIARRTLREFWGQRSHRDAEQPLRAWFAEAKRAAWRTPADIKAAHRNASLIGSDRVVFNVGGSKYRLVVAVKYSAQLVFIRWTSRRFTARSSTRPRSRRSSACGPPGRARPSTTGSRSSRRWSRTGRRGTSPSTRPIRWRLTLDMIRRLHRQLGIPAEVLLAS